MLYTLLRDVHVMELICIKNETQTASHASFRLQKHCYCDADKHTDSVGLGPVALKDMRPRAIGIRSGETIILGLMKQNN